MDTFVGCPEYVVLVAVDMGCLFCGIYCEHNMCIALNILCGLQRMHSVCCHDFVVLVTANILCGVLQKCCDGCPAGIFRKNKVNSKVLTWTGSLSPECVWWVKTRKHEK